MRAELTVQIDEDILLEAEKYARKHNRSLPKAIEQYLLIFTVELPEIDKSKRSPEMKELMDLLDSLHGFDCEDERDKYLMEEHK